MVFTFSNLLLVAVLSLMLSGSVSGSVLDSRLGADDSQVFALGAKAQLQKLRAHKHTPQISATPSKEEQAARLHTKNPNTPQKAETIDQATSAEGSSAGIVKTVGTSQSAAFANAQLLVHKPVADSRTYQHTTLENGMEVVNVHDEKSTSSAFSVAVEAGSFYDPPKHRGLAHLTEHALFLGTKSYPDRTGFDEYLAENGGASNAYTADELTVYYGSLDNAGFRDGLKMFADFFHAPSLNASDVYQEVSAVVSEHSKNVQNPAWYTQQVMKSTASNSSPIAHFHTGDASTLQNLGKDDVTNAIKKYFDENYCPPRMKLVTFGAEPVHKQLQMAEDAFGSISRSGGRTPKIGGQCSASKQSFATPKAWDPDDPHDTDSGRLQKFLVIQGTTSSASLWMLFPLGEDLSAHAKSHPMSYAEFLLGYGGSNSLQLVLRNKLGLANSVSLSSDDSSAGTVIWLTASLTESGLEKPGAVMDVIFTFLKHARTGVTLDGIKSLGKCAKLDWDWSSPPAAADAASSIAEKMTRLQKEDLLSGDDLLEEPDANKVTEQMSKLLPEKMNVGLVIPNAEEVWKLNPGVEILTLAHYDTKYTVSTLDDLDKDWREWGGGKEAQEPAQAYKALSDRLRAKNVLFEGDVEMVLPNDITGVPENMNLDHATAAIGDDSLSKLWGQNAQRVEDVNFEAMSAELWYRKGWMAPQPWVEASVTLRGERADMTTMIPAHDIITLQVGMHLLADELNERMADTGYKGFSFSTSTTHHGVQVWVGGFTPNMLELSDRLLSEMNTALDKPNPAALRRILSGLESNFEDHSAEAIKSAFADMKVLLTPRMHSKKEFAKAMKDGPTITYDSAKSMVEQVHQGPFFASTLVMGNYDEDGAKSLHDRILKGINSDLTLTEDKVEKVSPVVMPKGPVEVRKTNPREGDGNHVTVVTVLVGVATVPTRVLLGMVGSMYSQLVFAELRTKDELGYVVSGGVSEQSTVLTIDCFVQGEKALPDEVEAKCENVWANIVPAQLAALDDTKLKAHKDAFKSSLLEGPLTTRQELQHFENPILLGDCLGLRKAMLDFVETVTKQDLLEAWNNAILPSAAGGAALPRKKVVVKYWSDKTTIPEPMTREVAKTTYEAAGLSGSVLTRMLDELKSTKFLNEASSSIRDELVKEGGYFPQEIHCTYNAADRKTVVAQPEQDAAQNSMLEILASGADVKAQTSLLRKEPDVMRSVEQHLGGESGIEMAEAPVHVDAATHLPSHWRRLVARRPHLQPRPASPALHFDGFAAKMSRTRGNLPGLSRGRQGGRQRLPPWEHAVLPTQFPEIEDLISAASPMPLRNRPSRSAKSSN